MTKLLILASGNGTNFQAIIDACGDKIIDAEVSGMICNKKKIGAIDRAHKCNIKYDYIPYLSKKMIRKDYDIALAKFINENYEYDLIVLAGWMHILSNHFIKNIKSPIINLHPALPGMFPGKNAIKDAFKSFVNGKIKKTGIMVHHVVEEVDAGKVIDTFEIKFNENETLKSLKKKVKYYEKFVLIKAINKCIQNIVRDSEKYKKTYVGKVRDCYDIDYDLLAMLHSNRQSAFDKHICTIPMKGDILTSCSKWWFNRTQHIVPNHYLYSYGNLMIVKKCRPFKVEVVVRGYITGSTNTSLWTHYHKGARTYCGIKFPDGLVKNQKLDRPVITPTTKDEHDRPITHEEVVSLGLMEQNDWNYVKKKALELFTFGQKVAATKGLILVDTKYEFGRDSDGNIILIDEIHTCDSSRYWLKHTYKERFSKGLEPERFDKDVIRTYIRKLCDPYKEKLPPIPNELIEKAQNAYLKFYYMLTGHEIINEKIYNFNKLIDEYFNIVHPKIAIIISGSIKDSAWNKRISDELNKLNIYNKTYVASAHKTTQLVLDILKHYDSFYKKRKIAFITVAGMSNALGGVVSSNSKYPVINCPPFKDKNDMMVNLNSSIQNPSNVPVMTVLNPLNTALAVKKIFDL